MPPGGDDAESPLLDGEIAEEIRRLTCDRLLALLTSAAAACRRPPPAPQAQEERLAFCTPRPPPPHCVESREQEEAAQEAAAREEDLLSVGGGRESGTSGTLHASMAELNGSTRLTQVRVCMCACMRVCIGVCCVFWCLFGLGEALPPASHSVLGWTSLPARPRPCPRPAARPRPTWPPRSSARASWRCRGRLPRWASCWARAAWPPSSGSRSSRCRRWSGGHWATWGQGGGVRGSQVVSSGMMGLVDWCVDVPRMVHSSTAWPARPWQRPALCSTAGTCLYRTAGLLPAAAVGLPV